MAFELHLWFRGEAEEADFERLTEIAEAAAQEWRNVDYEVVEVD